jgi:hypothetical protein
MWLRKEISKVNTTSIQKNLEEQKDKKQLKQKNTVVSLSAFRLSIANSIKV